MALQRPQPRSQTQAQTSASAPSRAKSNGSVKAPAFIRATGDVKRRIVANIQGPEKTGKNHFAFTYNGGGPIYVHSFDIGLEGVIQKFQNDKEIYVAEYELTVQPGDASEREVGEAANKVWEQFVSNFKDSISSTQNEGLVVLDTHSEAWELLRLASFGKLTQIMPHNYAKPNAEFRDLVRHSYDGSNVALLGKMKDEWVNDAQGKGQRTGNKKVVGMSDIPFLVQSNIETSCDSLEGGGCSFMATILDSRLNPDLKGMVIENDWSQLLDLSLA